MPPVSSPLSSAPAPSSDRAALRKHLLLERERFVAAHRDDAASDALASHLVEVLSALVPQCLGVYWPLRSEFNAAIKWQGLPGQATLPLALPFARRSPERDMHYRQWDGLPPVQKDECGILTAEGAPVRPDVVLVPCLGFTAQGFRLGYGGGYFDRYLAAHPDTTAIGVAWSVGLLGEDVFLPEPHDQPMMVVVTEDGVVGGL